MAPVIQMLKKIGKKRFVFLMVAVCLIYLLFQTYLFLQAHGYLRDTVYLAEKCYESDESDEEAYGYVLACILVKGLKERFENNFSMLLPPFNVPIKNLDDYHKLREDLWPNIQEKISFAYMRKQERDRVSEEVSEEVRSLLKRLKYYEESRKIEIENQYNALAPPKILYTCDGELRYRASRSAYLNYNAIYLDTKRDCERKNGIFEIVDSQR